MSSTPAHRVLVSPRQSRAGGSTAPAKPSATAPAGTNRMKPFGVATGIVPKHQGRSKSAARQAPTCSASKSESEPRQTGFSGRRGAHPPRLSRFRAGLRPPPGKFLIALPSPGSQPHTQLRFCAESCGESHARLKRGGSHRNRGPLPGLLRGSSAVAAKRVTLRCAMPGDGTVPDTQGTGNEPFGNAAIGLGVNHAIGLAGRNAQTRGTPQGCLEGASDPQSAFKHLQRLRLGAGGSTRGKRAPAPGTPSACRHACHTRESRRCCVTDIPYNDGPR